MISSTFTANGTLEVYPSLMLPRLWHGLRGVMNYVQILAAIYAFFPQQFNFQGLPENGRYLRPTYEYPVVHMHLVVENI